MTVVCNKLCNSSYVNNVVMQVITWFLEHTHEYISKGKDFFSVVLNDDIH